MAVHFITPAPVEVVVTGHELVGAKRPYAVYNIVVREDGEEWRLQRRWNDLRLAVDQIQRENGKDVKESGKSVPKFHIHGFRTAKAMLEPSFLDTRAVAMQELLQAYLVALPTSLLREEGPATLLSFLGQTSPFEAGVYPTPASTPRSTGSGPTWWQAPLAQPETITEESSTARASQSDQVREACKKVLFEANSATQDQQEKAAVAESTPSPVKGVPVAEAYLAPSWALMVMWATVVILPVAAVAAKELFAAY